MEGPGWSASIYDYSTNQAGGGRLQFPESPMSLFGPMSTRQIERLEKIQAKGRKHYIFYTGILGWGMSVFLLTTF
jgi:hypothetical protein